MTGQSQIVILSGPPHAGKSSVAEALCARYDRMAHLDLAALGAFIRMGRLRPWDESQEGLLQRELLICLGCQLAAGFIGAGYGVVIEDIVLPEDFRVYADHLFDLRVPVHAVVLLPEMNVIVDREEQHPTEWGRGGPGRLRNLHAAIAGVADVVTLDPVSRAPEEVADVVMELASKGEALLIQVADAEVDST